MIPKIEINIRFELPGRFQFLSDLVMLTAKQRLRSLRPIVLCLIPLILSAGSAKSADIEVDAQLVLAVDVSRSMTPRELEIQRRGYAEALASREVISAIRNGLLGQVAITYVEWAGYKSQRVIVDWTLISNAQQAKAFANKLTAEFSTALRRTSISGALDYGSKLFLDNGFTSNRKIIDISGDGPNNHGPAVLASRAETLAQGIIINGLPLMTLEGMGSQFNLIDLDEYYNHCVIGGPGSFVLPVKSWDQFPKAVRQKLVLELAGQKPPKFIKAAYSGKYADGYDCLIGEKIWEEFRKNWILP